MSLRTLYGKERIRVLFVRPPRHYWPIVNESDNFLLPLSYPCLAAYLRERMPGVEVEILDCCAYRMGWRTLARELETRRPDVIGIGEKVVYAHEAIRAFQLARQILPEALLVAGGQIFSHLPEWSFRECPEVDAIVRFEGEETLLDLLQTLRDGRDPSGVPGIAYRNGTGLVSTSPRAPIEDLDSLPIPAYDLSQLDLYAPFGKLWPRAVTIQRARGCIDECTFCSWWIQEGRHEIEGGKLVHHKFYRTKSVERVVGEVELLYEKFGCRYLFWVDATWNLDERWLEAFSREIIRRRYKLGWWAFVRADRLVDQESKGVLELMVEAGLRHVLVGGERETATDLACIGKTGYSREVICEAFDILRRKYPQVFRQATILTGLRTDTVSSIRSLVDFAHDCHLDFAAFHVITPFPGTKLWEEALSRNWIEEWDFSKYDMFCPVMATDHLSRTEVAAQSLWCQSSFVSKKPVRYLKGLFSRHAIRRRLHWWFLFSISRVILRDLWESLRGRKRFEGFAAVNALWKPRWYEA